MLIADRFFIFSIVNSKEQQQTTEQHGGIGLNNVKRRLELLYPGRHELKIDNTENVFTVQLNLQLS
jgi:sensor histidine kinase YesM